MSQRNAGSLALGGSIFVVGCTGGSERNFHIIYIETPPQPTNVIIKDGCRSTEIVIFFSLQKDRWKRKIVSAARAER